VTHILLIEDNPVDARLLQRFLRAFPEWPARITWIDDGQKAIWYLRSLDAGGVDDPPAIVLLDFHLPKFDGLQILDEFRKSQAARHIPIFLLSSTPAQQIAEIAESRHLHADAYFEKPMGLIAFEHLVQRIRESAANSSEAKTAAA
jgi:CheY-like chemotaxis protein